MYFKNVAEKLCTVPDYVIEYFNKFRPTVVETAKIDFRKILGEKTFILAYKDSPEKIQYEIEFVQNYIMSQQCSILRDKIPFERSLCVVKSLTDSTKLPNRYINRIGENVAIILSGQCILSSSEFNNKFTVTAGEVWRYNSRIPLDYQFSSDFYALVISYVDFDLTHYLMPFDVNGMMPRRRDEFIDYDPNDESHKIDKISTNEY